MHPRCVATIGVVTASSTSYISFSYNNGGIGVNFVGDGSISWSRSVTTPPGWGTGAIAAAGSWASGDRFDVDLVMTTGVLTVKQYRGGTLLNTFTATVIAPNVSCNTIGVGSGRDYTTLTIDDLVVAVLP